MACRGGEAAMVYLEIGQVMRACFQLMNRSVIAQPRCARSIWPLVEHDHSKQVRLDRTP
jgi:hypothetical protein